MFEATKKLIEHCKHLPQMSRVFSDPLVELAEKEIAQIESQLTQDPADSCSCVRELHVTRIDVNCPEHGIKPLI